jgi:hypothetical protein
MADNNNDDAAPPAQVEIDVKTLPNQLQRKLLTCAKRRADAQDERNDAKKAATRSRKLHNEVKKALLDFGPSDETPMTLSVPLSDCIVQLTRSAGKPKPVDQAHATKCFKTFFLEEHRTVSTELDVTALVDALFDAEGRGRRKPQIKLDVVDLT